MSKEGGISAARYAEIVKFLWKYRDAGIFTSEDPLHSVLSEDAASHDVPPGGPESMASDLEEMGPAFVKIGQSLSTRPDLVSAPYIEALSKMQDQCAPIPYAQVNEIIESELGARLSRLFSEFDETPIASASLGQVHRARMRDGTEVAVKIQRPGAVDSVKSDLALMAQLAAKADEYSTVGRHVGFSEWVRQLRRSLMRELDYETEATNLETLADMLEEHRRIRVPQPVWDFTSQRVLTMEYFEGLKVTERAGVRKTEEDVEAAANDLVKAFLDQIFVHGFVHVDPHPGNVLLTREGELVLLDLGMVSHLSPGTRNRMLRFIVSIVEGKGEKVADQAIRMGKQLEDFDRHRVTTELAQLVSEFQVQATGSGAGMLLLQITRVATSHGLRPPSEILLLGKTLLNLEHLVESLSPGLDLKMAFREHFPSVFRKRLQQDATPLNVMSGILESSEDVQDIPRQTSRLLAMLADKEFSLRVDAIDELNLAANMQKIANRVAVGLIVAALIIAAALLMNVQTKATLWGYPAFAMAIFMFAGVLGIGLVLSVLWNDRGK